MQERFWVFSLLCGCLFISQDISVRAVSAPTRRPHSKPTVGPTHKPSVISTFEPSVSPTHDPSLSSTTYEPSALPSSEVISPSETPTVEPTQEWLPSAMPRQVFYHFPSNISFSTTPSTNFNANIYSPVMVIWLLYLLWIHFIFDYVMGKFFISWVQQCWIIQVGVLSAIGSSLAVVGYGYLIIQAWIIFICRAF